MTEPRAAAVRLHGWLRRAARTARAVLGAPDYERYLAYMATHRAGETPLTADEYVRRRLDARYSRPGARCC